MSALTAVTWVFAALLVVVGVRKVAHPAAGMAPSTSRPPSDVRLVRALGVGEALLGAVVLVGGGPASTALLAGTYAIFAVVAERQRRRGARCGCFGGPSTPATALHVWLDLVAAGVAGAAAAGMIVGPTGAVDPAPALPATIAADPLAGALAVALLAIAANLLRLLLAEAPQPTTAALIARGDDA